MEIGEARQREQSKLIKSNQGQLRAIKGDRTCPTELTPSEAARAPELTPRLKVRPRAVTCNPIASDAADAAFAAAVMGAAEATALAAAAAAAPALPPSSGAFSEVSSMRTA